VEVDEEPGHGVEESVAGRVRPRREAGQKAPVLEGVGEVAGNEDGRLALRRFGQADRFDGRELELLEVAEDIELAARDLERLLLQGEEAPIDDEEADEVARGADGQDPEAEPVGRPGGEGELPGEVEEGGRRGAEAEARKVRRGGRPARTDRLARTDRRQSRLRK